MSVRRAKHKRADKQVTVSMTSVAESLASAPLSDSGGSPESIRSAVSFEAPEWPPLSIPSALPIATLLNDPSPPNDPALATELSETVELFDPLEFASGTTSPVSTNSFAVSMLARIEFILLCSRDITTERGQYENKGN